MLTIFVAVMMHKAIMAFSLGLNIAQSSFSVSFFVSSWPRFIPNMKYQKVKAFVLSSLLFSLASPFGVGVGIKTTVSLNFLILSSSQVLDFPVCPLQYLRGFAMEFSKFVEIWFGTFLYNCKVFDTLST